MSNTLSELQRKIGSARDLQSVVRTMKAMAASGIGQYESSMLALADYYRAVEAGLGLCFRELGPAALTRVERVGVERSTIVAVVFGSDQGLVGEFNEVIADYAIAALAASPRDVRIWAVGELVHARLEDRGRPPVERFGVPASVNTIGPLVAEILIDCAQRHERGELSELRLFYNRPATGAAFESTGERLLPLDERWRSELLAVPWRSGCLPEVIGGVAAALRAFIREYLYISLFRACVQSLASENASRLAAMQRADRNIRDLLETLQGNFHRERQSSIDEELFDVIAGSQALTDAS